jgi:hypothetical protein
MDTERRNGRGMSLHGGFPAAAAGLMLAMFACGCGKDNKAVVIPRDLQFVPPPVTPYDNSDNRKAGFDRKAAYVKAYMAGAQYILFQYEPERLKECVDKEMRPVFAPRPCSEARPEVTKGWNDGCRYGMAYVERAWGAVAANSSMIKAYTEVFNQQAASKVEDWYVPMFEFVPEVKSGTQ